MLRAIAKYEYLAIRRNRFFGTFGAVILLFNLLLGLSMVSDNENFVLSLHPYQMPYMSALVSTLLESILALFIGSDFIRRDKKNDSSTVILTKPFSNNCYYLGKLLGIMRFFLSLNILITAIISIFHLISQVPIQWEAYLFYPIVITTASTFFIATLSMLLQQITRNNGIALFSSVGAIVAFWFFIPYRWGGLLDVCSVFLPGLFSEHVVTEQEKFFLLQRLLILLAGLLFTALSTQLSKRRKGQRAANVKNYLFIILLCLLLGTGGSSYVSHYSDKYSYREILRETVRRYAHLPTAKPLKCHIKLQHKSDSLFAEATLHIQNNTVSSIDTLRLTLNSGLLVKTIQIRGNMANFVRTENLLLIPLPESMETNRQDSLCITYEGTLAEEDAFLELEDNDIFRPKQVALIRYANSPFVFNEKSIVLPPQAYWYPQTALPPYPSRRPGRNRYLIDFQLSVQTKENLTLLSQGEKTQDPTDSTWLHFKPEYPLPHISLIGGSWNEHKITIDNIEYSYHAFPENDLSAYFTFAADSLRDKIKNLKWKTEEEKIHSYPFPRFRIIEVPFHFFSYTSIHSPVSSSLHPEMLLLTEAGLNMERAFPQAKEKFTEKEKQGKSPKQLDEDRLRRIYWNMQGDDRRTYKAEIGGLNIGFDFLNSRDLNPNPYFYDFCHTITSNKYPEIETMLTSLVRSSGNRHRRSPWAREQATQLLSKKNFATMLAEDSLSDRQKRRLMSMKGEELIGWLSYFLQIDGDLQEKAADIFRNNRFKELSFQGFLNNLDMPEKANIDSLIEALWTANELPAFLFSAPLMGYETTQQPRQRRKQNRRDRIPSAGGRRKGKRRATKPSTLQTRKTVKQESKNFPYRISMQIGNFSNVDGLIALRLRGKEQKNHYLRIPPQTAQEIVIPTKERYSYVSFRTYLSSNRPERKYERIAYQPTSEKPKPVGKYPLKLTSIQTIPPDEIIVDNEDSGFFAESGTDKKQYFVLSEPDSVSFDFDTRIRWWGPPSKWKQAQDSRFYGRFSHTGVYKRSGKGLGFAKWQAKIPSDGYYAVYAHLVPPHWKTRIPVTYRFQILHTKGNAKLSIEGNHFHGWRLLGKWNFKQGTASVTLTDNSRGRIIIGDAIKWKRLGDIIED